MSTEIEIAGIQIPQSDWKATPESVKAVVIVLSERLGYIEEQLKQNSQNSSRPPSSDSLANKPDKSKKSKNKKKPKSKPRNSSSGEKKTERLYPLEACKEVHSHLPENCQHCGEQLRGKDEQPYRHQIIEIPTLSAYVIEHQLHQLECDCCGQKTRAQLTSEVPSTGYGDRLAAVVAWLSGEHRQSHRMVKSLLANLFSIEISRGSINRLRQQVSDAVAEAVKQAHNYVQGQEFVYGDETGFSQGNGDGLNPQRRKGWLWVLATPLVKVFEVSLSRGQDIAKALVGEKFNGIFISDRYSAYNWLKVEQRQLCWAHIKRDLTAISQRPGRSQEIGEALLRREGRLFRWWHRLRNGSLSHEQFQEAVKSLREGFKAELERAAALPIGKKEKSPLGKTVRTARQLLKLEAALWTFVEVEGVEPTNNLAEQALRSGVIWRRTSFGSQSKGGSEFVARILTVISSLKAQQRNPLDYLTKACHANRLGLMPPSLLPLTRMDAESPIVA